ncbi:MAG: hypothetical protein U1C97_02175 [Candidatus Gracilibacteria bacterium]|nr:hypothetical protein [bacterium]MDZ4217103.1 hypothetical protein [Candidatus Gracilibacteria bacterium]
MSLLRLFFLGLLITVGLHFSVQSFVFAQGTPLLPLGTNFPGVQVAEDQGGAAGVVSFVNGLFDTAKQLLGPVLVFIIAGFGIQLIIARGEEERFSQIMKNFLYVLVGVAFVILAQYLSETFSLYKSGSSGATTFISTEGDVSITASRFTVQLGIIVKFLRYTLGGIAFFYIVKSGATILLSPEEETATKEKEVFLYGFVGFLLIMISEALVNVVFDINTLPGVTQVNVGGGIALITNVTDLFLASLSGLFLFTLVIGGAMYTFSAGSEERGTKATNIIIGSLLGLVIAFSSYTIVHEFAAGGRTLTPSNEPSERPLEIPPSP